MKLILVESPTKARTLSKYLKGEFAVEATMGHIRDLPKTNLGVDIEHGFEPSYIVPKDKKKRVTELSAIAKRADEVILATDPDREGEAIAWHVAQVLADAKGKKRKKGEEDAVAGFKRISFHEITETAIREALNTAHTVDMQLVAAQQARRVLDRLVGYKLSPLLWQKLGKRWLSAGRVQSVAVRLIVEREREIAAFAREEYWTIEAVFAGAKREEFTAKLVSKDGVVYEKQLTFPLFDGKYTTTKTTIVSETAANDIVADMTGPFTVSAVDTKEIKRYPGPPYTTSTLQQDAGRRLYFSSKKTMQLAQKLYEEGFITYHRTDSVNLASKFIDEARVYITATFGAAYVPAQPKTFQTKSKVAQEAHEAIRPTDINRTAEHLPATGDLNHDHVRLYELIRKRAIACQMHEAIFDSTTIRVTDPKGYQFEAQGSVIKFDGYLAVMGRDASEAIIPKVAVGETLALAKAVPQRHETAPPPRYTEAGLVKTLEEKDIGRPSTYAPIISTVIERQYVKKEDKKLMPTDLGNLVVDFLVKYFPNVMSLPFTATMEGELDAVANGAKEWVPVVRDFWDPFAKDLANASETAERVKMGAEETGEACPQCGKPLVIRTGRFGKFIACSGFPDCKYTRQYGEKVVDVKCPKCGGDIVAKKSRKGKSFYGCSNYPTCTFAAWRKEDIK